MERGSLIPWSVIFFVAFLILAGLMLTACATRGPYWIKVREARPVRGVLYVPKPCGHNLNGCARYESGILEIKNDLDQAHMDCVLSHEKHHMDGYDHPEFDTPDAFDKFATDCGNGEVMP